MAANVNEMVQALLQIFNDILAVNSVFASSSLPLSADNSGAFANQVYMGVFRPDAQRKPRWVGNLKQYKFAADKSNAANPKLFLADSTGAQAISGAGTGFISPNAISFWTTKDTSKSPDASPPTGPGGFWVNDPQGAGDAFDSPDGELVEKGGVGQQLRLATLKADYDASPGTANNPRNLYTCVGSCGASSSLSLSGRHDQCQPDVEPAGARPDLERRLVDLARRQHRHDGADHRADAGAGQRPIGHRRRVGVSPRSTARSRSRWSTRGRSPTRSARPRRRPPPGPIRRPAAAPS